MAFQMTLGEAKEALTRAKHAMGRVREKAEEAIGSGLEVAEVGGTAFGFGYVNGRWGGDEGEMKVFGLPVDLGVGIALTGVSMFGGFGKYAEHGVNVGAGAIASYAYRAGHQLGSDAAQDSPDELEDELEGGLCGAGRRARCDAARRYHHGGRVGLARPDVHRF